LSPFEDKTSEKTVKTAAAETATATAAAAAA